MQSENRNSHRAMCQMSSPTPRQKSDFKNHPKDGLQQQSTLRRCWDTALILNTSVRARDSRPSAANSKSSWARILLACISPPWQLVSKKKKALPDHTSPNPEGVNTCQSKGSTHIHKPLTFMFCCTKRGNPSCDYFAFPSF